MPHHRISIFIVVLILTTVPVQSISSSSIDRQQDQKDQSDTTLLEQGKTIEREIKGGESHTYKINLSAGEYLRAAVEQKGIELYVTVYGPNKNLLIDIKAWKRYVGMAPIHWIAAETGSYTIRVYPSNEEAVTGRYKIMVEEIRTAGDEDRLRVSAQADLFEAHRLYTEGSKESKTKAIEKFTEALSKYKTVADLYGQGYVLDLIGSVYFSLGQIQKALEYHNQALPLLKQAGDNAGEAATLNYIGEIYNYLGEPQKSLDYLNQALPLRRQLSDRTGEAQTLNNIAQVYGSMGDGHKVLDYINQALLLNKQTGDRAGEAETFNNLGQSYYGLGDNRKALECFLQSLSLRRQLGDQSGEVVALNNAGFMYNNLGEKQKALDLYNQSLLLCRHVGNRAGEPYMLNNIGMIYQSLGEYEKALDYLNQALPLRKQAGDRSGEAKTLQNIGLTYELMGENKKVLDYFNQALLLYRQVNSRGGEALALNNIGKAYISLGENQKALDYFNQSLSLQKQFGSRDSETETLNNIGVAYDTLGDKQKALEYYNQALLLCKQVGDYTNEAKILFHIAKLENDQENLSDARAKIERAIDLVELIRASVAGQGLRSSFFAEKRDYYELYEDVLMRLHKADPKGGFDSLALQVSEKSRARGLVDLLAEAKIDIREGVDKKLLESERGLRQLINEKSEFLLKLKSRKNTAEQAAQTEKEIESLISEFNEVENRIRATSPKYAALTQPEGISIKEIQQQLDPDTVLLEYSLGEKRSYLWLVSQTSLAVYELPARKQIEDRAKEFYNLLTSPMRDGRTTDTGYKQQASELGRMLLGPAEKDLAKKRLLVVAEGALQYIPFATLSLQADAYVPLILNHEIANIPSVSTLAVQRRELANHPSAGKLLAVIADPVFEIDDPRVKQSLAQRKEKEQSPVNELEQSALVRSAEDIDILRDKGFARLLGSRREANAIASLADKEKALKALDFDASQETATSEELTKYRFIHIATHGLLNSKNPELSGLVLSLIDKDGNSKKGFLKLNEIYNLKLNAELVVLSGCQTGLGKQIRGEGLVGLTRGFMYAGAKSIVASLWNVQDFTTSDLMTSFYQAMLKAGKKPAEALRLAQIEMLKNTELSNPYYWAGFTFQGDWR